MKAYIQYMAYNTHTDNYYEPCGDRAVVVLDGRNGLTTMINDAHQFNGLYRPKYPHFKIMKGDFRNAVEIYTTLGKD